MDDRQRAAEIRARAQAIRDQARKLTARAEQLPPGRMREMLIGQAKILTDGAGDLEKQALALMPTVGTA
ncbi:MAG TPA: hypothetical protein VME40_05605 [Caulobacteraceae bacterium]|nr:hypothetical protein [Caulobacteraceae bacterium]